MIRILMGIFSDIEIKKSLVFIEAEWMLTKYFKKEKYKVSISACLFP